MHGSRRLAISIFVAAALAAVPMTTAAADLSSNAVFVNQANSNRLLICTSSHIDTTGTATLTIPMWSFSGCSFSGVFGTSVTGMSTNASTSCPYNATIDDSSSPATITIRPNGDSCSTSIFLIVSVTVVGLRENCAYSPTNGSLTGSTQTGGSSITFSNQPFTRNNGRAPCFSSMLFSATYGS